MVRFYLMAPRSHPSPGPFRAEHIPEGSPYELSNGHPVFCLPTGRRGGHASLIGGEVLETDPAAKAAGVDVGFSKDPSHLRAPDISVGDFANEPGWAPGAPPLAVEYADTGQDEAELENKIAELLDAGTQFVWVVRLVGPRRVEVHEPGKKMWLAKPGDELTAPGILKNSVPVLALFDREAAHEATLRNLMQRRGYESLEAALATAGTQGEIKGKVEALFAVLKARGLEVSEQQRSQILAARDLAVLERWLVQAVTAATTERALSEPR
jgi:Uma2 family endonuclease